MTQQEKLLEMIDKKNIAEDLTEEQLIEIGEEAVNGYDTDKGSRKEWEDNTKKWMELALQVCQKKTFPWQDASNVKFPLISIAAMQFSARAYPSLVPQTGNVVNCRSVGADPDGQKRARAIRISKHMSYQVMEQMDEWEEDMDKLLLVMAITGVAFKKVFFDPAKGRNVSRLVYADDLIVNNWTKNLQDAERITEVFYYSKRKIKEMQLQKLYLDVELGEPSAPESKDGTTAAFSASNDTTTPHTILEQHTYLDLDNDGYAEPYIVTVDHQTRKVLRITACYSANGILVDEEGSVVRIVPNSYYVKYGAIPNPTGSFYNLGFGHLLGPINESVNTIINQLIDAGSLSNLQSGFIGKGIRTKMGETRFRPGEWKTVNATGDDLKKQIFPMPVREPSNVLFQLMGTLVTSGKELASVAEIMVGKMPGQNTPAYTTKETVEQGMKLFTAIYKRVYRSLKEEFRKLYVLNREYLDMEEYVAVLDEPIQQSDYEGSEDDIIPAGDPSAASSSERMAKVQEIFPMVQLGTINPMELTKRALEAQEQPNVEQLLAQPQPPKPDPKVEAMQMKAQLDMAKGQQDMQIKQQMAQLDAQMKLLDLELKKMTAQFEFQTKEMDQQFKMKEAAIKTHSKAIEGQQKIQHTEDMFTLKAYEQKKKAEQAGQPKEPREPKRPKQKQAQ